jgi:uncharacterized protein YdeI (YjbR/CyaY-like superfamily)
VSVGVVSPDGRPVVYAPDRGSWRRWLEQHHNSESGAWLVIYKKGSTVSGVTYDEAVEEALAFGWIDSRANRLDDTRYVQFFTRRKPRSAWSPSNKERVERLIAEGRMTAAGMALVEEAKRNGRWD